MGMWQEAVGRFMIEPASLMHDGHVTNWSERLSQLRALGSSLGLKRFIHLTGETKRA